MKLIVEDYKYKSHDARSIIENFNHKVLKDGVSTDCVGYCYSKSLEDCIFFAPKVILDSADKVLGKYNPEVCVNIDNSTLSNDDKSFLQDLNVWVYRSLKEYGKLSESSEILHEQLFSSEDVQGNKVNGTLLDTIIALVRFHEENKDFIIFTLRNAHSQNHKINWQKTITKTTAIIKDDIPVYLDPISKEKAVNWDEELMIIYFSILDYISKYGFEIKLEGNYNIIQGEAFESYRNGLGSRKLRQIKHRYFSDKAKKLWSLCYNYFNVSEIISSSKDDSDFLIATSFHTAFEAMVDELVGDPDLSSMRNLDDGKIIDHIYRDKSLLSNDLIYFIGDSKYYKTSNSVEERSTSAYKQYTYARNIVHDSINKAFNATWPFRDPLTEGYTITPNFFISAEIDEQKRYDSDGLESPNAEGVAYSSRQFNNRLFDRDTLWVNQYNLNFLYLLSTYASADNCIKESFRYKARNFFREHSLKLINRKYEFWELAGKDGANIEEALTNEVKWALRGLIYRLGNSGNTLILAMEKPQESDQEEDNHYTKHERILDFQRIKPIVNQHFTSRRCVLSSTAENHIEYINDIDEFKKTHGGFFFFFFFDE